MTTVPIIFDLQTQALQRNAVSGARAIESIRQAITGLQQASVDTDVSLTDLGEQLSGGPDSVDQKARQAGRSVSDFDGTTRGIITTFRGASTAIAGFVAALGIREVIQIADAWQLAENRLNALIGSQVAARQTQAQLVDIANETRVGFVSTADAFARLALGGSELGISNERLLGVTRTLNQAIVISGASAAEANAAMIQLAQGIASGALRGDELRSVLEQLPIVARLIARDLGVTTGELRELGAEGAITSEVILRAFENNADEIAEAFARTEVTVGQALTVLGNTVTEFVGRVDQATGSTSFLARAIQGVAEIIDTQARISFPTLTDEIARLEEDLERANTPFLELARQGLPSASASAEILSAQLAELRAQLELETESAAEAGRRLRALETTRRQEADARRVQSGAGQEVIEALEFELGLIGATNSERQAAIILRRAGADVTSEEADAIRELTLQIELEQEALRRQAEAQREVQRGRRRAEREAEREAERRRREAIRAGEEIQAEEDRRLSARTGFGSEEGTAAILEREREIFQELERIRQEQDETELDRIRRTEEERLNIITEARRLGLITEQELEQRAFAVQLQGLSARVGLARGFAEGLATTLEDVEGLGQAAFVASKALAVAEATVATAQGVAKALASSPPPQSFVLAGITAALGAAQIGTIIATTVQGLQAGGVAGMVGGAGTGDSVPALLEPGEFVVNRQATARNLPRLMALNKQTPRFQRGGEVGIDGFNADGSTVRGAGGTTVFQIDARGSDIGTVERIERVLADHERRLRPQSINNVVRSERRSNPGLFRT